MTSYPNMLLKLLLLAAIAKTILSIPFKSSAKATCGYEGCPTPIPEKLNIHIIPHSHDDVGWLKTVDQYYYGNRISIQRAAVQYIIDSVVDALADNADRKFVQVESAFFWKWWIDHPEKHDFVKQLVEEGRLEFIGGAWSMNDEAATHYQSIIDHFTLGLRFLNDTFGSCAIPTVGWQIDPFGHSREMASIFTQLGYDSLYFARLDYLDKQERQKHKSMEMLWRGSSSLGESSDLFTSVLYNHYSAPGGFCFDILCRDEYIIDDESSPEYNAKERADDFVRFVTTQSQYYQGSNLLVTFGDDFHFQDASLYFKNLDRLIKNVNKFQAESNGNVNVFYSTPSCYAKALHTELTVSGVNLPTKTDDFMPYASDFTSFWTGYYTSRPTQKRFERQANNLLQVLKQIYSVASSKSEEIVGNILPLQQAMGVMQHHDAITGTEKTHVAQDYARMVFDAIDKAEDELGNAVHTLFASSVMAEVLPFKTCFLSNVSHCEASNEDQFVALVYNPLSRETSQYVRLPVNGGSYKINDPIGSNVDGQLTPAIHSFEYVEEINPLPGDLVFLAENIQPMGMKMYHITRQTQWTEVLPDNSDERLRLGTDTFGCTIDPQTGLLNAVINGDLTVPVKQQFYLYYGAKGANSATDRSSGAYVFRPSPDNPQAIPVENAAPEVTVYKGDLVDEAHQIVNDWIRQIIRVYKQEKYIEFDWMVGPIPIDDNIPKEIISRFTSDLKTEKTFYTDSNGREMLKRIIDYRPSFNFTTIEHVSGNYYPITSRIVIKDESKGIELSVLNDRAQGGSSLNDGEVELMVHRRLLNDDAFGVGEALNEEEFEKGLVVRGQHYLIVGKIIDGEKSMVAQQRELAQKKILSPWTFVAPTTLSWENLMASYELQFSGMIMPLPENVQILTLEPIAKDEYILRLEHIFESGEDDILSQPVNITDIEAAFSWMVISDIKETVLGANQLLEDSIRLDWVNGGTKRKVPYEHKAKAIPPQEIELNPMEIRTFIVQGTEKRKSEPSSSSEFRPAAFISIVFVLINIFLS